MSDVPFLKKEVIEAEALSLLAEYGQVAAPPVPIDDIVELHLKLTFAIMDLQQIFGDGDVHGAIWFRAQRVGVDQSLDPARYPAKRGRYHFTLAHETGHWRLHRKYFLQRDDQNALFDAQDEKPDYVCRSSQKKLPVEWQADQFAANLLMPRTLVRQEWERWNGSLDSIVLTDIPDRQERLQAELVRRAGGKSGDDAEANMILENISRPLAEAFEVSPEAMRIRLEEIGFLLRKKEASLFA